MRKATKKAETKNTGRRNKYASHVEPKLMLIEAWARDGLSMEQIAHNCGVADSTFRSYVPLQPALSAALSRGREVCDVEVENALHKKAMGYNAKIKKHYKVKRIEYDPDTGKKVSEREELVEVEDEVHVPADTEAQKWWLSNRDKLGKWRYKPEPKVEESDNDTGVIELPAPVDEPTPPPELMAEMEAQMAEEERGNG